MAYTSIIPVSRLDNSITYIRNKDKTTKKGQSAGSLEEAIDYAMNRDKTERSVFEDAIGCVCETAYQDMVATKETLPQDGRSTGVPSGAELCQRGSHPRAGPPDRHGAGKKAPAGKIRSSHHHPSEHGALPQPHCV